MVWNDVELKCEYRHEINYAASITQGHAAQVMTNVFQEQFQEADNLARSRFGVETLMKPSI